jgi:hypothetical protein
MNQELGQKKYNKKNIREHYNVWLVLGKKIYLEFGGQFLNLAQSIKTSYSVI